MSRKEIFYSLNIPSIIGTNQKIINIKSNNKNTLTRHFGINTKVQLLDLVVKHREFVLEQDEEELSEIDIRLSKEEYGEEFVNQRLENKFWFAYPALLRNVLELEFGEEYIEYADKRDNLKICRCLSNIKQTNGNKL